MATKSKTREQKKTIKVGRKEHNRKQRKQRQQNVCFYSRSVLRCRSDQAVYVLTHFWSTQIWKLGNVPVVCQLLKINNHASLWAIQTFFVFAIAVLISCKSMTTNRMSGYEISGVFVVHTWFLGALWPNSTSLFTYFLGVDSDKIFVRNLWHTKTSSGE